MHCRAVEAAFVQVLGAEQRRHRTTPSLTASGIDPSRWCTHEEENQKMVKPTRRPPRSGASRMLGLHSTLQLTGIRRDLPVHGPCSRLRNCLGPDPRPVDRGPTVLISRGTNIIITLEMSPKLKDIFLPRHPNRSRPLWCKAAISVNLVFPHCT